MIMVKYWNGKIFGIPAAIVMVVTIMLKKIVNGIRCFFVTKNFKAAGDRIKIGRNFTYRFPKNIMIGKGVIIGDGVSFTSELSNGWLEIRDGVVIGRGAKIDFSGGIIIDEDVLLSENVNIQSHDHGYDPRSVPVGSFLMIEKGVWIGMHSMILSKVRTIGEGAIIGANSLVTKDVEKKVIMGGNPARILKIM